MTPLTSTLADLTAAKLVAYYPVPTPGVPIISGSTDPAVYVQDPNYIKELNRQSYHKYAVDVPNQYAHDRLDFAARQWEANKSATNLPKPGVSPVPAYVVFDDSAFDQWWAQYSANPGQDAPLLYFVKPAPLPPDPVILNTPTPAPTVAATDGPIGAPVPNNPGVFNSSASDNYPDGYVYAGPTGIYQKHVFTNPFTAGNTRIIWIALQQNAA